MLLIEAGGDPPLESVIIPPIKRTNYTTNNYPPFSRALDWQFKIVPSSNITHEKLLDWPRGKVLGGSSSINAMIYFRGNRNDYKRWVDAGNAGWSFADNLPYFKKSENNLDAKLVAYSNGKYHSDAGPMKISPPHELSDVDGIFYGGGEELGIPLVSDTNADVSDVGFFNMPRNWAFGKRQSTNECFLLPAKHRTNLCIMKNTLVYNVLIDGQNRVYGVNITHNGEHEIIHARKEVILSGGVIGSPVILMQSGIGPKDVLNKFNIPIRKELPVGENLVDHVSIYLFYSFDFNETAESNDTEECTSNKSHLVAFLKPVNGTNFPNFKASFNHFPRNFDHFDESLRFGDDVDAHLRSENKNRSIVKITLVIMDPKSRGTVKLNGTDNIERPIIDPRYFSHEGDLRSMLQAIKYQLSFFGTESYKKYGVKLITPSITKCAQYETRSDDWWRCYIKYFTSTNYHAVGTCRMGPVADPTTVVSSKLKVHWFENLRVIDASM